MIIISFRWYKMDKKRDIIYVKLCYKLCIQYYIIIFVRLSVYLKISPVVTVITESIWIKINYNLHLEYL